MRARVSILSAFAALFCAAFPLVSTATAQVFDVSTQPALYPSFDPAVTDYVIRCTPGIPVAVTVAAAPGTQADVDGHGALSGDFTDNISLNAGQSFRIVATAGPATSTYRVRCLPSDFPAWTFERSGQPQAQWYMVAPIARTDFQPVPPGVSTRYAQIFDGNGVPIWWFKEDSRPLDFKLFSNGNFGVAYNVGDEEHRLDGTLVQTVNGVGMGIDTHEFSRLANGDYLLATYGTVPGQTVCGQSNLTIQDSGIEEIAPNGSLVWSWRASDHIPTSEIPSAWCNTILSTPANGQYDVYHLNSIEPDGDSFVASFRHEDAVYKIRKSDGGIVWKLGGTTRPESLTVLGDPLSAGGDSFRGQHDARVLQDGTVTIHDNGFHPSDNRSPRAVRFSIDPNSMTATLVEQKNFPGSNTTPLCCGSARKLDGGDWLVSWGSTGLVTELSPSGQRVFSLTFDDQLFSYRAHPVPFGTLSPTALRDGMDAQYPRGFVRPRWPGKLRVPLVPAYRECLSPNRIHGAPLSFDSCSPPAGTSGFLTVGTPDANGAKVNSTGFVAYTAHAGDPSTPANDADVRVGVTLTDVRLKSDLSDYTGELQAVGAVRITDRLNGSLQNEAATGFDTEIPLTVPCTAIVSDTIGATCSLSSSFNAILPGTVVEGKRAIWGLGQIQVFDGGSSGTAGASDATLFETQGLFVP